MLDRAPQVDHLPVGELEIRSPPDEVVEVGLRKPVTATAAPGIPTMIRDLPRLKVAEGIGKKDGRRGSNGSYRGSTESTRLLLRAEKCSPSAPSGSRLRSAAASATNLVKRPTRDAPADAPDHPLARRVDDRPLGGGFVAKPRADLTQDHGLPGPLDPQGTQGVLDSFYRARIASARRRSS